MATKPATPKGDQIKATTKSLDKGTNTTGVKYNAKALKSPVNVAKKTVGRLGKY